MLIFGSNRLFHFHNDIGISPHNLRNLNNLCTGSSIGAIRKPRENPSILLNDHFGSKGGQRADTRGRQPNTTFLKFQFFGYTHNTCGHNSLLFLSNNHTHCNSIPQKFVVKLKGGPFSLLFLDLNHYESDMESLSFYAIFVSRGMTPCFLKMVSAAAIVSLNFPSIFTISSSNSLRDSISSSA